MPPDAERSEAIQSRGIFQRSWDVLCPLGKEGDPEPRDDPVPEPKRIGRGAFRVSRDDDQQRRRDPEKLRCAITA
jgi:hypothetical protein